ncbi:MAG: glycosyltransferase [Microcoleaceae cyanobacterium]
MFYRKFFQQDYYSWAEPFVLKNYANQISQKLSNIDVDVILTPENVVPIAYLKAKQPIVLYTDATIASLINFYPYLNNLCQETLKQIYDMEKKALDNCELAIYTSEWAAQTAIDIYKINSAKVKVIPWGPNLDCDRTKDDINQIVESRLPSPCKLLFMGFEWSIKGGDIATEVAKELNAKGLNTELIVVGANPPNSESLPDFVKAIGKIDKFNQAGKEKFNQILSDSHFLILPTKAETFGHVFCEANSFGVPCLTSDIGGIPTVIKDGLNGKKFSLTAEISEYCQYITSVMNNYQEYKKLALSSFGEYESRLNWVTAAQTLQTILKRITK